MNKTNKTTEKKHITLYDFHKRLAVFSLTSGLVFMVYGVLNYSFLDIREGETWQNWLKIGIMLLIVVSIIVFTTLILGLKVEFEKEKEDELYKENVSKANAKILKVLIFLGELVLIAGIIFLDEKSIEFRFEIVSAIGYLLASTYNFMILHYEKCDVLDEE